MKDLFYTDTYCRSFEATVVSCTENSGKWDVVLNDTIFYPEGGGQPADTGLIGTAAVEHARREGGVVVHTCSAPLEEGSLVACTLDWDKRFENMQNHSGEHILSGIINQRFGFSNTGFHMADDFLTVDFDGVMSCEEVMEVEKAVNEAIFEDKPVEIFFPSAEELDVLEYRSKKKLSGNVRIVRFPGSDTCACCGLHVSTTAQIGICKVLSSMKHRGGTRIEVVFGTKALRDHAKRIEQTALVSAKLSAKQMEIAPAVEKLCAQLEAANEQIAMLKNSIMSMKVDALPAGQKCVVMCEENLSTQDLRRLAKTISEKGIAEHALVLSPKAVGGCDYVIWSTSADLPQISRELNKKLSGRGGGNGGFVQGSYKCRADEAAALVRETFENL